MLADRYKFDGKPTLRLNNLQLHEKAAIERKIATGRYRFNTVDCAVCGERGFDQLSEKDRYGLYVPAVICRTCGLIQTNPRMSEENYSEFYREEYRKLYVGVPSPTDQFFGRQLQHGRTILEFIQLVGGGRHRPFSGKFVVEIGTGAGGILQAFKDAGNDAFGVDVGAEYLAYGRARGLDIREGTVDDLVKIGRPADLIIYSHVLEHTMDPVAELVKARSALAPGGLLYIEVPGVKALTHSYRCDFLRSLQNAHTYYFTLATLTNVARRAGLAPRVGDEDIRSLFVPAEVAASFTSDYRAALSFLEGMEGARTNSRTSALFRQTARRALIGLAQRAGISSWLKMWYYRVRYPTVRNQQP